MIPIVDSILKIVGNFIPDQDKVLEVRKLLLTKEAEFQKQITEQANAEIKRELKMLEHKGFKSWWRQFLAFGFGLIMIGYGLLYLLIPQIIVIFNLNSYYLEAPIVADYYWYLINGLILGGWAVRSLVDKKL